MTDISTNIRLELGSDQMLKTIFDYVAKIGKERDLKKLLKLMTDMGRDLIVADRCSVWLVDRQQNELWTTVAHGVDKLIVPYGTGIIGHAIERNECIFIDDAHKDARFNPEPEKASGYRSKALLAIPMHDHAGNVIGAFQAVNKMTAAEVFSETDIERLQLVASYSAKALETAMLYDEIEETQREILFLMGEIGETRSKETGNHVRRVAEYSRLLALYIGMDENEANMLKQASPMHDIGKVAIPDEILKKPGKLTEEEFAIMQTHAETGHHLLVNSPRKLVKMASILAYEHHEKFNGKGYPRGLEGNQIDLLGRITAVADVFDALGSDRCYKKAWDLERILALFREERGQHFCPRVTDAFLNHIDSFITISKQYTD